MSVVLSVLRCPDNVTPETRRVTGGEFCIGRDALTAQWVLPDPTRQISRQHCLLRFDGGVWHVTDQSANGTFLNRETAPIGQGATRTLKDGDRLRIGPYEIEARLEAAAAAAAASRYTPPASAGPAPDWGGGSLFPERGGGADTPFGQDHIALPQDFLDLEELSGAPSPPPPATTPDHSPAFSDAMVPLRPLLPDNWDEEFAFDDLKPAAPARPSAPAAPTFRPAAMPSPSAPPPMPPAAPPPALLDDLEFPDLALPAAPAPFAAPAPAPAPAPAAFAPAAFAPLPPAAPVVAPPRQAAAPDPFVEADPFAEPAPFAEPQPFAEPAPFAAPRPAAMPLPAAVPVAAPAAAPALAPVLAPVGAPVLAPVGAPAAASAPTSVGDSALLAAFMEGAGLADLRPQDPLTAMRNAGAAFRAFVAGLREVLVVRAEVKDALGIDKTYIRPRGNNPLKFSAGDDDALTALLGTGRRTEMTPQAAVVDALRDIRTHEQASLPATQAAVRALLGRLAPEKLRATADAAGGIALPAQKRARAWDLFEAEYEKVAGGLADDFDAAFGRRFADEYARIVAELRHAEDKS